MLKIKLTPSSDIQTKTIRIKTKTGSIPVLVLKRKNESNKTPVILWIHGGGFEIGMKEMAYMTRGIDLVKKFGATVVSPGYHLSWQKPYPAAINDCYDTLKYIYDHADELSVDKEKIIVGGESAGGGLACALCIMARDKGEIKIAFQMPLYPMLDNLDTPTNSNNHAKVWNTKKNKNAWRLYLRKNYNKEVSPYASPARLTDFANLPPAYTFVGTAEPFYFETVEYFKKLKEAGVECQIDIYDNMYHAFDIYEPNSEITKKAIDNFEKYYEYACSKYLLRK